MSQNDKGNPNTAPSGQRGNPHRNNNGYSKQSGGSQTPLQLPEKYLDGGYFDGNNRLRKELFINWPKQISAALKGKMSASALRNFYNEAKTILSIFDGPAEAFENSKHRIWKLKAFTHYASQKKDTRVPYLFVQFIEANLPHAEKSKESYRAFVSHFECVVAYFKE